MSRRSAGNPRVHRAIAAYEETRATGMVSRKKGAPEKLRIRPNPLPDSSSSRSRWRPGAWPGVPSAVQLAGDDLALDLGGALVDPGGPDVPVQVLQQVPAL